MLEILVELYRYSTIDKSTFNSILSAKPLLYGVEGTYMYVYALTQIKFI